MRWATRAGVHIDRAACAWLIRRHIDADAEFLFVDDRTAVPGDPRGLSMTCDDERVLALSGPIVDGLHEYQRRAVLLNRTPG